MFSATICSGPHFSLYFLYHFRPGPNSPIDWVRSCVKDITPDPNPEERAKILLGLNFYGYDYGPQSAEAMIGPR